MSTRLQQNMDKKAPAQRISALSPVALVVMGLVGAADALASVREALLQSQAGTEGALSAKTTVLDYNAVASLVQALVREGLAPEEAALQVQFALQGPNPMAALSALAASVAAPTGAEAAQDAISLPTLVEALTEQVAQLTENGHSLDVAVLQDAVPSSAGFAQADLAQALETFKALEQGVGAAQRGGNADVAQNQIDVLLAQAAQAGAAVATDAGAATAATASAGAATGAAAVGAMSAAQALALIGFAAVAGGAFDSGDSSSAASSSGNVVKGPITGATVFRDLNGNYILDAGEASTTTTSGGAYTLSGSGGKIVATGGTYSDGGSGTISFTGMLAAPSGASVVTPLTTLLAANSSLTAADLKSALGLSFDPLTFNPFATGVSAADALKAEGAAAQVNTILTSLAVTVNGASGGTVSLAEAVSAVANKLGAQVATQAAALKVSSSAGTLNLGSDSVFTTLVTDVKAAVASKVTLSDSDFSTAVASAKTTNATIASVVTSNGSLTSIASTLKSAQGSAPVANPSLLPDVSVAEDAPLSGAGGTGALSTLPSSFTATNISRANLLKFFDNDSSTTGQAPTLTFDITGYAVADNGTSSLDLVVSLQKTAFAGRDLTVTLNDVKLDAATASGKTTLTLPAQTISATVKMGSVTLGTFTFSNVDSDALTLNSGSNTVGASPSFSLKLDSLFAKMTNGVGDVLDLTALSNKALVALGGALVVGALDDLTPASVVAKLKSLITLPTSVDSVSELVTLAKNVIDFPQVSSLKISDLLGQIPAGSTKTLLLAAADRAHVDVTTASSGDTISSALTKFSTSFGTYKLSDLSALLSNGLGLDQGVNLVSVAKELVVAALNKAEGLTAEQILDKAIGALIDANNGDLRALLAGVDYQSVLGTHVDALNVLNNIVQHGTVKYVDLINLGAHTLLSSDATMVVQATDFKNLAVTSGGVAQTSLQVSVPIGTATSFTPSSNGLGIPVGAFTDADTGDVLKYTATLESGAALPSWLTFNGITKSFTGTPTNDNVGSLNIKITAIDPAGNTASDVFKLTVTNVNDAPQLISGAVTTATAVEFASATFDVSKAFIDVDAGDALTYSAASGTTLPTGWTLTTAGVLSGTAPLNSTNSNATQTIKITATDKAGATVTQDFTLTVTNDTTAPVKPTIALERDNGVASNDGITSNGTINVTGLETAATWSYSLNNGTTWALGTGTSFVVPVGNYATQYVQVRQTDQAGNVSEVAKYTGILDIRTAPVTPTVTLATPDSGAIGDGITNSGIVNVGQLLTSSGASWQYSINSGSTWTTGTGSSFTLTDGAYLANQIQVRQSDGNFESLYGKIAAAVTIDSAKPVLTAAAPSLNTTSGIFTYTFTSTEALTGFDVSDINVTGGVKGNALTTADNKTFTIDVTPTASSSATATASDLSVAVAATAATDAAGNSLSAAVSVANSILFGTPANQTITGTASADTIYGGGGTDIINAGAGNDSIMGGAGNDVITGGAGADKIDLSLGGSDVLKFAAATDSPVSGADSIAGFASGDKIDLSAILGANGIGYLGENSVPTGSSSSLFTLVPNPTITNGIASVDVIYNGDSILGEATLDIDFLLPAGVKSMTVPTQAAKWLIDSYLNTGVIAGVVVSDASSTVLAKGSTFATVNFEVPTGATSFIFAVESVKLNSSSATAPLTKSVGTNSTAQTGYYTIVDDGTTLGTVGDNEIHFANNPTTKTVDIRYDTNKATGTPTASDIIHLDGITGIDLTKTDFTFI